MKFGRGEAQRVLVAVVVVVAVRTTIIVGVRSVMVVCVAPRQVQTEE